MKLSEYPETALESITRFDLASLTLVSATLLITFLGIIVAIISLYTAFTFKDAAIKAAKEAAEKEIRDIYGKKDAMSNPGGNAPPTQLAPEEIEIEDVEDEFNA